MCKSCGVLFFFKGISLIENESKVVHNFKAGLFQRNSFPEHSYLSLPHLPEHFPLTKNPILKFVSEEHSGRSLTVEIKMEIDNLKIL